MATLRVIFDAEADDDDDDDLLGTAFGEAPIAEEEVEEVEAGRGLPDDKEHKTAESFLGSTE